jgi:hypothetical protein
MNTERVKEIRKSFEMNEREKSVLRHIGWYYHNLYSDNLDQAFKSIQDLGIYKIIIEDDIIYLCLERPGVLIGLKGSNIDNLQKFLIKQGIHEKICIVEVTNSPLDYLTSWQIAYLDWNEL